MECDICLRGPSPELGFCCTACARGTVYAPRLEAAKILLDKEQLGKQVQDVVGQGSSLDRKRIPSVTNTPATLSQVWSVETQRLLQVQSKERIGDAEDQAKQLRESIDKARLDLSSRKDQLKVQRTNLETIKVAMRNKRHRDTEKISETSGKSTRAFEALHTKTQENKALLCREAALLLRFKQRKKKKDGVVKDHYSISDLLVADLKEINGMRCSELTASISMITHLLVLTSFYLSVRLPAEITAPHRGYPLPTIFTPANSYLSSNSSSLATTAPHSSSNSPTISRHGDAKGPPRPWPLFINAEEKDEKVAQVAKKDPAAFAFFLEGISLLAWDIAWLCRSQGFTVGTETWEDVCNIGRNLWMLLLAPAQSAALMRVLSSRDVNNRQQTGKEGIMQNNTKLKSSPRLGEYSHSSAQWFLGASDVQDRFRGWKVAKHTMIVDPLKKTLWAEMNNAEWELLEEQEWDDGGEQFDEAVFIKTRAMDGRDYDDARSIMTARPTAGDAVAPAEDFSDSNRTKGTSGWTKVKSRDK